MKLTIKINLDNAAFDLNDNITTGEVRRLLIENIIRIQMAVNLFKNTKYKDSYLEKYSEGLTEINGNKCGKFTVKL